MSLKPLVNAMDHIQGNADAMIELVEYGDYQCPHCGHAYPIIKDIQEKLGDKLKLVFRNFPLQEIHPSALDAAIASEAAALQNKFWEMHDIIFENQRNLTARNLLGMAKTIGLDPAKFSADIHSADLKEKVLTDFESGIRSGVNGTPTFYINGSKYAGSWEEGVLLEKLTALYEQNVV